MHTTGTYKCTCTCSNQSAKSCIIILHVHSYKCKYLSYTLGTCNFRSELVQIIINVLVHVISGICACADMQIKGTNQDK